MVKIHNKHEVLKLLLSDSQEQYTIRAIAHKTGIDYKTTYLIVKQLTEEKTIITQKAGQATLCSVNQEEFNSDIFRAEYLRRQDLLRNKDLNVLYKRIDDDIKEPFFILLLFGSYAKANARKQSDIDLLLITDRKKIKKDMRHILSLLPLRTHLIDFSSAEFLSMLRTTDFNVGKEAVKNNIILSGIEGYYKLIHDA